MGLLARIGDALRQTGDILSGRGRSVPDERDLTSKTEQYAQDWTYRPKRDLRIWPWTVDQMRNDPTLMHAVSLTHAQLLGAQWEWLPGSAYAWQHVREASQDGGAAEGGVMSEGVLASTTRHASAAALAYADHANRNHGLSGQSPRADRAFEEIIGDLLDYTDYGWKTAEAMYRLESGKVWLADYKAIPQHCHVNWVRRGGTIVGEQLLGVSRGVHLDKLLVLNHMTRPNDLRGYGAMWAAYDWYQLKQHAFDLLGIGAERWTIPTPVLNVDRLVGKELGYRAADMDAMVSTGRQIVENYMGGRQGWLMANPGVNIDVFANNAWNPAGLLAIVGECDKQQASAYILRSILMGTNAVAPRASLTGHQTDWRAAAGNNLDRIALRMSGRPGMGRGHMARTLEWNEGRVDPNDFPILVHTGIKVDPILELVPYINPLVECGALTVTNRLEQRLLKSANESLPDEARRTPAQRRAERGQAVGASAPQEASAA